MTHFFILTAQHRQSPMDPVTLGVTMLGQAGKYLLDNGGKEVINKASTELFEWVKSKFTTPELKEKVDAVKTDPEDKDAQAQIKQLLDAFIMTQVIDPQELKAKAEGFEQALQEQDPNWLKAHAATTNISRDNILNEGDSNKNAQNISGTVNIN